MMPAGPRTIYKRHDRAREEVGQLLGAVFAGELLSHSDELWIVSPWIRDLTVLDNRAGDFSAVQPLWGLREIRLLDCLVTLLQRGATVRLKTGTEDTSVSVMRELERRANDID